MEAFLREQRGSVLYPVRTEDLQVLIERHVESLDVYADLDGSHFGHTDFSLERKPSVCVSRELSTNPSMSNPFRTTLTHEFGHVMFHDFLYQDKFSTPRLPGMGVTSEIQSCHRDQIVGATESDWLEWQAGYASGAFLMPISAVSKLVGDRRIPDPERLIGIVADQFQTSTKAARVRLIQLGVWPKAA